MSRTPCSSIGLEGAEVERRYRSGFLGLFANSPSDERSGERLLATTGVLVVDSLGHLCGDLDHESGELVAETIELFDHSSAGGECRLHD